MTDGKWPLDTLLSEVVGSGPKSATDMSREQAKEAMTQILQNDVDPTTLGAFLLANRWKRNTPVELAAFVDVMIERSVERVSPSVDVVDCGANYDGKTDTALLGVGAGIVAAAAGTPIVVHSGDRVPTLEATTYKHVLEELQVETDLSPGESAEMVEETGFGLYYQPRFNRELDNLLEYRRAMGVRTFLNTVETLANPAGSDVHIGSFYHLAFAKKLASAIAASEKVGFDRAILFQGLEGYDDLRPGLTQVADWNASGLEDYELRTDEYDMGFVEADLRVDDVTVDSARITERVLAEEREDQFADAIALNAAIRIYAGGETDSIADGLAMARSAIQDGSASSVLADLRAGD